jgi:hypothetical protein
MAACFILPRVTQQNTERSHCHSVVKENQGKPQIIVEPYHKTVSALNEAELGFDLLGGTTLELAKRSRHS